VVYAIWGENFGAFVFVLGFLMINSK